MSKKQDSFQFGGMAVLEGVMMRSLNYWSVAVRAASGDILVHTEHVEKSWIFRQKWLKFPFVRGTLALLDTMFLGNRAMRWAGDIVADERFLPLDQRGLGPVEEKPKGGSAKVLGALEARLAKNKEAMVATAVILGLVIGFAVFDAGPTVIAQFAASGAKLSHTQTNIIEEILKAVLFLGYLLLIRRIPALLEVFRYHGAEHAAINAMESGLELTPDNCLASSRFHLRCGTNFMIMVLIIGFVVFIPLPRDILVGPHANPVLLAASRVLVRLLVLPLIAGISYEIIRAAGRAKDPRFLRIVLGPGLATQIITTEPPKAKHAEVAIAALKAVEQAEAGGELANDDPEAAAKAANERILASAPKPS